MLSRFYFLISEKFYSPKRKSLHFNFMEIMALNNDFFPETQLNTSMWTLRMSFPILIQELYWQTESFNIDSYLCNLMSVEMRRGFIQNMKFPYFSLQIMEHYKSQVFISLCLGNNFLTISIVYFQNFNAFNWF